MEPAVDRTWQFVGKAEDTTIGAGVKYHEI